jgi:hypothetical protein
MDPNNFYRPKNLKRDSIQTTLNDKKKTKKTTVALVR